VGTPVPGAINSVGRGWKPKKGGRGLPQSKTRARHGCGPREPKVCTAAALCRFSADQRRM